MRKYEVRIGATYAAKIAGTVVPVRIFAESSLGGWRGRNMRSGREVRIKSAQKLRYEARPGSILPVDK